MQSGDLWRDRRSPTHGAKGLIPGYTSETELFYDTDLKAKCLLFTSLTLAFGAWFKGSVGIAFSQGLVYEAQMNRSSQRKYHK